MSRPSLRVSRRVLLAGLGIVLAAQAATLYAVRRMTAAAAPAPFPPAHDPPRPPVGFASRFVTGEPPASVRPGRLGDGAPGGASSSKLPLVQVAPVRLAWSGRALDDAGQKLADELGRPGDDLRLFADEQGRVSEAGRRDLLAGRDAALRLADQLGVAKERDDELVQLVVGYMVRRVTMRESFRGKAITPEAIDASARADALASVENNFDPQAKDAVAATLAGLPDLTADMPPLP